MTLFRRKILLQTNPLSPKSASRLLAGALLATALIASALPAGAVEPHQKDKKAIGGAWDPQGPSPVFSDLANQPGTVLPDGGVVGAVHALAPHPVNPDILYIGAVNGGVWVTHDANAVRPTWQHLTDNEASQSVGAMELDPTDPKHETLVVGPGVYSAYGVNGDLSGLLLSTDGGSKWKRLEGHGVLLDKSFSGIAVRGGSKDIVVSVAVITGGDGCCDSGLAQRHRFAVIGVTIMFQSVLMTFAASLVAHHLEVTVLWRLDSMCRMAIRAHRSLLSPLGEQLAVHTLFVNGFDPDMTFSASLGHVGMVNGGVAVHTAFDVVDAVAIVARRRDNEAHLQ